MGTKSFNQSVIKLNAQGTGLPENMSKVVWVQIKKQLELFGKSQYFRVHDSVEVNRDTFIKVVEVVTVAQQVSVSHFPVLIAVLD
jgi:hypothetical protein